MYPMFDVDNEKEEEVSRDQLDLKLAGYRKGR